MNKTARKTKSKTTNIPLHLVEERDEPAIRTLVAAGADVNAPTVKGVTPLRRAIELGLRSMCTLLLASGADAVTADKRGITPLHRAATSGDPYIFDRLVKAGADIAARDARGDTPLHRAIPTTAYHNEEMFVARRLVGTRELLDVRGHSGRTPLHLAVQNGLKQTTLLVEAGADVNARDDKGLTPLHCARTAGIAELLMKSGATVDARDNEQKTPLHHAVAGCGAPVGVLLAHGADIHARDAGGLQPIDCVNLYTPAIAAMLLLAGADPAALARTDDDGETFLHRAALVEDPKTVGVLLAYGADIHARTTEGLTPRDQARHCSVIALLDEQKLRQRTSGCQAGGRRTAL